MRLTRLRPLIDPDSFGTWTRKQVQDGEMLPDGTGSMGEWYETDTVEQAADARNEGDVLPIADVIEPSAMSLIIAAPDLARALLLMLDAFGNCGLPFQQEAGKAAGAALRKAGLLA